MPSLDSLKMKMVSRQASARFQVSSSSSSSLPPTLPPPDKLSLPHPLRRPHSLSVSLPYDRPFLTGQSRALLPCDRPLWTLSVRFLSLTRTRWYAGGKKPNRHNQTAVHCQVTSNVTVDPSKERGSGGVPLSLLTSSECMFACSGLFCI